MEATGNIADYKVLYDELHIIHDALEVRFASLVHELAQMKKMIKKERAKIGSLFFIKSNFYFKIHINS